MNKIRIVWIPNPFSKEGREEKFFDYVNGQPLEVYFLQTSFPHAKKDIKFLSSQKGRVARSYVPVGGEEIIITPDVKGPFMIGSALLGAFGLSSMGVATYGFFALATTVGWVAILATVAVVGFSIYSAFQKPKRPSYGTLGGTSGSLEESSPTYAWDGVRTIQEVGVPVGLVYGKHKVGGNIINQFVQSDGSQEYLNLLLGLGEGEIDSISDVKINGNPFENFSGVEKYERMGTNTQEVIAGFEELHNVYEIGATLAKDVPYIQTTIDNDVEVLEVEISFPYGLYEIQNSGDLIELKATVRIEYKEHSAVEWTALVDKDITEKSRTTVRKKYRITGLTAGQYDVRCTKISDDSTSFKVNDMRFSRLDEIKMDDLAYPNTALLGLKLLATNQLSGITPSISCVVKGLKIKTYKIMNGEDEVPYEDYYWDSEDEVFRLLEDDAELSWDGETYTTAWTANPAWILYDIITKGRYGLGEFISTANLDLANFVEIAKICDEKLPKDDLTYEKRFELDVVLDSAHTAIDVLLQLCATFRAWSFYSQGTIRLKIDKPDSPTQLFGMGNIISGSFKQAWKSQKDIPNVIEVQFLDANKDYEQEIVAKTDELDLQTKPMRKKQVRIFTTSLARALREGRYALNLAKYIHRSITFKASIDAIACQAGDLISVSHELPEWGKSGRILAFDSEFSVITLDQEVTIEAGKTYKLRVKKSDDTIEEKTVTNAAGTTSEITVSGAWTGDPSAFDVWAFGETNLLKKDFRIISMERETGSEVSFKCVEYSTLVYDDTAPITPEDNYYDYERDIPSVVDLLATERLVKLPDGTIKNVIDVWFNKPDISAYPFYVYTHAKIYLRGLSGGGSFAYKGMTDGTHFVIEDGIEPNKSYRISVTSVSSTGVEKSIANSPYVDISVLGKLAPPSNVQGFSGSFYLDHIKFAWTHIADVDLSGYEIRELPYLGANWNLGVPISVMISDNTFDYFNISASGNRFFAIKAIDTSGIYSQTASTVTVVMNELPYINIIEEVSFSLLKGEIGGDVETVWTKAYSPDYYKPALQIKTETPWDDGGNWNDEDIPLWDQPVSVDAGHFITDVVDLLGVVSPNISVVYGVKNESGGFFQLYIAASDDNPEPSDWVPFVGGSYSGRYFRFKIVFGTLDPTKPIAFYMLKAVFDVEDVDGYGLGLDVALSDWTEVLFEESFTDIKLLIVTPIDQALIAQIAQDEFPSKFKVKLFDIEGNQVAGKINYFVKGY